MGVDMKNKLSDLNDHLFMALERLNDEDLTPEQLNAEIDRAKAIGCVAANIIANQALILKSEMAKANVLDADFKNPVLIGNCHGS